MKYEKKMQKSSYDVVIIGSGMAGLVAGALLAHEGLSVLVLEQHFIAGGCTSMFRRKSFSFEAGGHRISMMQSPGGVFYELLRKIGKSLAVHPVEPSYVVRMGDKTLKAAKDIKTYAGNLVRLFPGVQFTALRTLLNRAEPGGAP